MWELRLERQSVQQHDGLQRTYGDYQVFIDGNAIAGLSGHMCECIGPSDNKTKKSGKRIQAGTYNLSTQFGRYVTIGYSTDQSHPGALPMPAVLLEQTGNRDGILIHPAHPPNLYLSSIGCLNPTKQLAASDEIDFWDSRQRVIALIDSLHDFCPAAFQQDTDTEISNARIVISGEPMAQQTHTPLAMTHVLATPPGLALDLPITPAQAVKCAQWMMDNFASKLAAAVQGKAYRMKHLCALVCQESACYWLAWVGSHSVDEIVARCVFDASGDDPTSPRSVFPQNTAQFRQRFGDGFTDMLIEEANKTRRLRGFHDKQWVYKGYGLFQYDLQNSITGDEAFFRQKQWYDFDTCLSRCCLELDAKLQSTNGDLWQAIKSYNGSGPRAQKYLQRVKAFTDYCAPVTGD
ncbi:peptidase S8/S53 subtilisin kexin sedolisin [Rhizobium lusitanum]|uniref:Uncharacterized protein n=1 Tax=Rhizobium lusitanum TaxID=293958 RepID=A0A7X0IVE2_9HYPH|nr:peptidase S8/S53 subtilisin kexin sedolisin [Rhizobium lusitanum]MBB6487745.1 hypothetical protein [Rhizobium lusitanum]